jgi:hypothetical protein
MDASQIFSIYRKGMNGGIKFGLDLIEKKGN